MSEADPRAESPLANWSDLGESVPLPTGTVTFLLADVESSTRLWETQPEEMAAEQGWRQPTWRVDYSVASRYSSSTWDFE